jgi:hypothetical protein
MLLYHFGEAPVDYPSFYVNAAALVYNGGIGLATDGQIGIAGNPTTTTATAGKFGTASVWEPGTYGTLSLQDDVSILAGNWTLEFWTKRSGSEAGIAFDIRNKSGALAGYGIVVYVYANGTIVTYDVSYPLAYHVCTSATTLTSGQWTYVAVRHSRVGVNITEEINIGTGAATTCNDTGFDYSTGISPLLIYISGNPTEPNATIRLDEMRFSNYTLTDAEVAENALR